MKISVTLKCHLKRIINLISIPVKISNTTHTGANVKLNAETEAVLNSIILDRNTVNGPLTINVLPAKNGSITVTALTETYCLLAVN